MKKILLLISSLAAIPLITSCTDYGVYGSTVGRPIVGNPGFVGGGFGNTGFVGGGLAPLQVGFVATSFNQWAYDPFRRHYFDRSCGRYFDPRLRSYCTSVPRRFTTAVYPSGYRRGGSLACPTYLPRNTAVARRGNQFGNGHRGTVVSNRGRFTPVVHGSSRGSTYLGNSGRFSGSSRGVSPSSYGTSNRGSSSRSYSTPSPVRRTATPVPSRRTVSPSPVTRSNRLRTISTPPSQPRISSPQRSSSSSRYTPPTVRRSPAPVVRSQPTRSAPTVRSPGPTRSTTRPSRAVNQPRQRTR